MSRYTKRAVRWYKKNKNLNELIDIHRDCIREMNQDEKKHKSIIRRKAKRIQRASKLLSYFKYDIESLDASKETKDYLLKQIGLIEPYLINDDYEENKYNYDNKNS